MRRELMVLAVLVAPSAAFSQGGSIQVAPVVNNAEVSPSNPFPVTYPTTTPSNPIPSSSDLSPSYSASSTGIVPASSATDLWCITGSSTKTIKVAGIRISGTASSNTIIDAVILRRSSLNTGGTSTAVTIVPNDSSDAASTASVRAYTANPTTGTLVGHLRTQKISLAGGSSPNVNLNPVLFPFANYDGKLAYLRNATESLCVNLNGQTISGGSMDVDAQWTEE